MEKRIIAITGPSGVGKTTLVSELVEEYDVVVPMHCTTRQRRNDDIEGFYRYLSHEDFKKLADNKRFLLWSGDSEIINKKYGNFYGILNSDCEMSFRNADTIIILISYKDVGNIELMKNNGLNIYLINMKYDNIELEMEKRLKSSLLRRHTDRDIRARINCAIDYENHFGNYINSVSDCIVYTDHNTVEETYKIVSENLNLNHYVRKRIN